MPLVSRLSLRLSLPLVVGLTIMWVFLLVAVQNIVDRFAAEHVVRDLTSQSREISRVLDDIYENLAITGGLADSAEIRSAKTLALSKVEQVLRLYGFRGAVIGPQGEVLFNRDLQDPQALLRKLSDAQLTIKSGQSSSRVEAAHISFEQWGWRVLIEGYSPEYAALSTRMASLYLNTGVILALALGVYLTSTMGSVARAVRQIVSSLEQGRKPKYKGIREFTELSAAFGAMMDNLKEREAQVRAGIVWYRSMFETAPVMMFTVDAAKTFVDINHHLCLLCGYRREDLTGRPVTDVFAFDTGDFEPLLKGRPVNHAPARMYASSGEEFSVLTDAVVMVDPSGAQVALVVVMDLTPRLKAEREIIAARDQALEASRAKSEFLANVSHEIRTPLNGVLGMLQLLGRTGLDRRQDGYVRIGLESGRSLQALLSDILDFSSLDSGAEALRPEPFSPAEILSELAQIYTRELEGKNVTLRVEAGPDIPDTLLGEGGRLRQVLFNLVGNAVKFTPQGSVTLRVDAYPIRAVPDGRRLVFCVEDTGIGIPAAKLSTVFDPFTQVDGSHSRRYQGVGLGLAIVKRLVMLWGGTLAYDTDEGQGTTVCFTMPVRMADPAPAPVASVFEEGQGRRVLLAEDDPVNTMMTMDMLESLGYRPTIVDNGQAALQALSLEDFDCLILDIQMPKMDGLSATQAVRTSVALGEKAAIPIVAMTAHAMPGDRERCLDAGMDAYISKPVEYDNLAQVLAKVMHKPWRESTRH